MQRETSEKNQLKSNRKDDEHYTIAIAIVQKAEAIVKRSKENRSNLLVLINNAVAVHTTT